MSSNAHQAYDLAQMQALPLEAKIRMTKQRIKAWYESWTQFEIKDDATGKTRFVTIDTRDYSAEPPMKETEYVVSISPGHVYVSVSGKDSTVLKHLVDSMYSDVPAVFVNTGLEYPEIQKFWHDIKKGKYPCFNSDVEIIRPEMRFDEVIKKYGYPVVSKEVSKVVSSAKDGTEGKWKTTCLEMLNGERMTSQGQKSMFNKQKWKFLLDADFQISHKCCDVMKKKPAKEYEKQTGRKAFIGTLTSESKLREQQWIKYGCNAFNKDRPTSQPLSFWTEQDILHYIKEYDVPYCSVYGDIVLDFNDDTPDEQINIIDYLGEYEPGKKRIETPIDILAV